MIAKLWLLLAVVGLNTIGQIMFKLSADSVKYEDRVVVIIKILFTSIPFWFGLCFYGTAIMFWIWVLRSTPLSIAYSATALVFVAVPIVSFYVLNEPVPLRFWAGAILIGLGVWLTYSSA